ncbi:nicotinamide riboside transporter PnuC [Aquabacterium sp. A7-Y]|uniref:nicotinamide riboside transporter PnuC n=1 Tax=Aquabacterium sp. A7-Y TaxID=1349605 RepID=UPI00223E3658|nr:nicotinamide riboside transporter PnuC [Aquabacterium sp. A7-Y]MCW7537538.1 nicotinamide riboside transporter PnuC [Aquabacterium sp. A7-Y]
MTGLEGAANAVTAVSIGLAARNSLHTWWTGMLGCTLFGLVFLDARLYADFTLQLFFIATSALGWWQWRLGERREQAPVSRARRAQLLWMAVAAALVTVGYGSLLHQLTDAWAPYVDSAVLALSVMAQLLLMQRRLETWPAWLAVNTLAVPLFAMRGLQLTALLYACYWLNAWYGWWRWHTQWRGGTRGAA